MEPWPNFIKSKKSKFKIPDLDISIGFLCLLIGIMVLIESILFGNNHFHFFVVLFFPSLLYLFFRKRIQKHDELILFIPNKNINYIAAIFFFLSISLLIWISYLNVYYRSPFYFFLCIIASVCVLIQIFTIDIDKKYSSWLILFEIIILAVLIKTSLYYGFSGLYGQDPWWHTQWIKETIEGGHITSGKYISNLYSLFPQFHLLSGLTSVISSLSINNSTFFSVGFIGNSVISTLFLFLIAKRFIVMRGALLTALTFSLTGYSISRGTSIIPMTLGISFFLIIIYLTFNDNMERKKKTSLLLLFSISLILTHTIAAFVTFICMTSILLSNVLYNVFRDFSRSRLFGKTMINASFVILFGALMLFVWRMDFPHGNSFFDRIGGSFINALQKGSDSLGQSVFGVSIPYAVSLFIEVAFLLMLFFALICSLLYLSREERDITKWGLLSLPIILYGVIIGFSVSSISTILPWRWYVFLMVPLSIVGILGLLRLGNITKNNFIRNFIIGGVIIAIILFSLITPPANQDNPPFFMDHSSKRSGWTQSELVGAKALNNISLSRPITDLYYGNIIPYVVGHDEHQKIHSENNTIFIWRNYYLFHPEWNERYSTPLHMGRNFTDNTRNTIIISDYMTVKGIIHQPLVYANGNIKAYILATKSTSP